MVEGTALEMRQARKGFVSSNLTLSALPMKAKHRFEHNNHTNLAFLLTAVALQGLIFWLSFIVYEAWVAAFGSSWHPLEWVFCILSFSFISATFLAVRYQSRWTSWYYWFAAYWFAGVGPLFGSAALFVILERLGPCIGLMLSPLAAGFISFGIGFGFVVYGVWQGQRAQIVRRTMALPNLPADWQGKKIVLVADLHLGAVRALRFSKKVARKIKARNPEIILIAGDLFDGVKCDAEILIAPLKDLGAKRGVYLASGNHDYYSDREHFFRAFQSAGIHILNNKVIDIDGLQIAGVDFQDTNYRDNFIEVLKGMTLDMQKPSILVRHEPTHLDDRIAWRPQPHHHDGCVCDNIHDASPLTI